MNKAVFLDRDGVINRERNDYTFRLEDFEILPDVMKALKILKRNGFLLIIISNQSGIGKGLFKKEDTENLHEHLLKKFKKENIQIEEIYYCVHHPETGNCLCRKPDSLNVEKALARFNINPVLSYFIGDKERDVLASEKAGVKGILMKSNTSLVKAVQPCIKK
jgi:D-glycero-D-manno-heptose 1,7-bisphosphate phosphatase